MNDGHGAPRTPWKARVLHHDAERFLRAPGCNNCIDRDLCRGLNTQTSLLDCMEDCCGKPDSCTWVCRRNPRFKSQVQEIGGLSLDNIKLTAPALPVPPLPPVIPLIYHGYSRAAPLNIPVAAIKLAQLFDKRTGAPHFASRDELCRRFALSPSTTLVVSGVDKDRVIERWWEIGQPRRLAVIESMKAVGVALVTLPNFSLCVDWPRPGDIAAIKRIGRVYAEFMNAGLPATLHTHGRTDTDFLHWAALLRRLDPITCLSYEFTTGAAHGERRDRHIAWLAGLAGSAGRSLHLVVYGDTTVVRELKPAFASITLIETTSFMKAIHRQEPVPGEDGRVRWRTHPTRAEDDLSDLLRTAIGQTSAQLSQTNSGTGAR
jgi:hypothetical protein